MLRVVGSCSIQVQVKFPNGRPVRDLHLGIQQVSDKLIGSWGGGARLPDDGAWVFDGMPPGEYWVGFVDDITALHRPGSEAPSGSEGRLVLVEVRPGAPTKIELEY